MSHPISFLFLLYKVSYSGRISGSRTADLCKEKVERAKDLIKELSSNAKIEVSQLSLNVTAHTGPGTVGIGIKKRYKA